MMLMTVTNLASTSVDTRPGTILRISVPNKTTNLSIAKDTTDSVPLKQHAVNALTYYKTMNSHK